MSVEREATPPLSITVDEDAPMPRVVCSICGAPFEQRQNILKPVERVEDMPWFPTCRHGARAATFESIEKEHGNGS